MGYKNRAEAETDNNCLSEALLFATVCIIGLPVDVHVRDGSVYSGIFYTTSVDKDYGIVLKEAKLTKKGKYDANVANGSVIETLVILSGDLVQVVAKGVSLATDGIMENGASGEVEALVANVTSPEVVVSKGKESSSSAVEKTKINMNRISTQNKNEFANSFLPTKAGMEEGRKISTNFAETLTEVEHGKTNGVSILKCEEASDASVSARQIGDDESFVEQEHQKEKFGLQRKKNDNEVSSTSLFPGSCPSDAKVAEERKITVNLLPNGVSYDPAPQLVKPENHGYGRSSSAGTSSPTTVFSSISPASSPQIEVTSDSRSGSLASSADMDSQQNSESNKGSKEFKLNPGAKIFCPSFATTVSASAPVPTVTSLAFIPSHPPMVPVATATQPEVGINPFVPRPSVPAKFAPYTNLTAVNDGSGPQFPQPIVGHMGNRTQPLRYAGQYHAVQTAPAYVPPNSQAVMVGRLGQLVYVQPVPHDLVQNTATISPLSARSLLTTHQVQYPKHQASAAGQTLQLCAPPPFVAGGQQQPFPMSSHIPLIQPPIPTNRPIAVPGSNALFGAKFP